MPVDVEIIRDGPEAWKGFCAPFLDHSLIQTHAFGAAKAAEGPWRVERGIVRTGGATVAVFQALVRDLPARLGGLVWINRGPLWRRDGSDDPARYAEILEGLKRHYASRSGYYLRIAPPHPSGGDDETYVPSGFQAAGSAGWASARLDLRPDESALRKSLQQKWRNCLNKGEKLGIEVVEDGSAFDAFVEEHDRFVSAAGFETSVTGNLLRALAADGKGDVHLHALVALRENRYLGGVLIADYGDTAEYLAGNTTDEGRKINAGQVLLWKALCNAKSRGRTIFDVGGMDDKLTPAGIYRFKEGLGCVSYRLGDEIEALPGMGLKAVTARLVRGRVRRARDAG